MKKTALLLTVVLLVTQFSGLLVPEWFASESVVYLSDLQPTEQTTGYGVPHYDENLEGGVLSLTDAGDRKTYTKGICIHAESSISFDISSYDLPVFAAVIGMDDGSYGYKDYAGASFEVWADGVLLKDYGTLLLNDAAVEVMLTLPEGTRVLTLKNGHGTDGSTYSEHCNWCQARLIADPSGIETVEAGVSAAVLPVGGSAKIDYTAFSGSGERIDPAQTTVSYVSKTPETATVDAEGTITAIGAGAALVGVTVSYKGKSAQTEVQVLCIAGEEDGTFLLNSPDGTLQVVLSDEQGALTYSVYKNGECAVESSPIGYLTEEEDFTGGFAYETKTEAQEINDVYPNYSGSFAFGEDHCMQQSFVFSKGEYFYTVTIRAYADGYAVRSTLNTRSGSQGTLTVTDDKTAVRLPAGTSLWGSQISKADLLKGSSYETGYPMIRIENAGGKYILKAPIASVNDHLWVLLSEADVYGDPYIGSIFKGVGNNTLEMTAGPSKTTEDGVTTNAMLDAMSDEELDGRLAAIERVEITLAPSFTFPWRYGVVGQLREIVESDLTDNLNPPAQGDFSWVDPGFTAWMWLSEGFQGQRNEQTIREYVDLASSMGWKYLILDEGWQPGSKVAGKSYDGYFDYFEDLLAYAEEKGVGFIAWVKLYDLNTPEKREILTEWANMGIKGIKFDFVEAESLDRMVNVKAIYEKCAEVHLLVNEHGGNIPTGERRTYPNVINRESVKGQEYGGVWCTDTTVMPYTRSAVGPTDITPKLEATGSNTAAHQLALQIVIESGMPCMASDTEVYYASNAKYILSHLPAFWDDLHFIDGTPGTYTVLARRKGDVWYAGGITVSARTISLTLDFIEEGKTYTGLLYKDGSDGKQIVLEKRTLRKGDEVSVDLLRGGGFSLMLMPEESFVAADSLDVSKNVITLQPGQKEAIETIVVPEAVDLREISFVSDNPSVAKVDAFGVLTAQTPGVAHVTATLPSSGLSAVTEVRVCEEANYTLSEQWEIVNGSSASPIVAGGDPFTLKMPVLPGDTTGIPQNLYLQDAPTGDFTLTVRVSGGLRDNYDSIGLIAYGGSGNMVVVTRRYHSYLGGNIFCMSNYNGGYIEKTAKDASPGEEAWLKLEKKGNVFTGSYSFDGITYTALSETITAEKVAGAGQLKIGVCGIHGNQAVSNLMTATMRDFTLDGETIPFCVEEPVKVLSLRKGSEKQLVPGVLRTEDRFEDLTFTVQDPSLASVSADGVLTARDAGVTKLTVTNRKTGQSETSELRIFTMGADGYGEFVLVNPQSDKLPVVSESDPYTLTMKTLTGDINALPKNLLLTGAPGGDFTLTVQVSGGLNKDFQSIGLVVFNESGSMVTMERRSHSYFGGNVFCASTSIGGAYTENRRSDATPAAQAYLKLVKQGNDFTGSFSFDGVNYTAVTKITNAEVGQSVKMQVGIIARTGSYQAETDAVYKDFTLNGRKIPFTAQEELLQLIAPDAVQIAAGDDLTIPETLRGFYNTGRIEELPVQWDFSGFDARLPGVYTLRADYETFSAQWEVTVTAAFPAGDLNGDGAVDILDVTVLLNCLAGNPGQLHPGCSADVNGSGTVNINDVTVLLNRIAGTA